MYSVYLWVGWDEVSSIRGFRVGRYHTLSVWGRPGGLCHDTEKTLSHSVSGAALYPQTPHWLFIFPSSPPPGSWVDWQQHSSQCKPPGGIDLGYAIQKTMPSRRPTILKGWMIFFSDEQQKKHYSVVNDLLSGRLCSIFYEQVGATCSARGDFILPVVSETHRLHYVCKKMSGNSQFFRVIPRAKNKSAVF